MRHWCSGNIPALQAGVTSPNLVWRSIKTGRNVFYKIFKERNLNEVLFRTYKAVL